MKQLFIAVDIDGVVADSYRGLSEQWTIPEHGIDLMLHPLLERNPTILGHELGSLFVEAFYKRPDIVDRFPLTPGAVEGIHALTLRGHRIAFVSARPHNTESFTRAWIERNFGQYPVQVREVDDKINGETDKSSHDSNVIIEDSIGNALKFIRVKNHHAILFITSQNLEGSNRVLDSRISFAVGWEQVVRVIDEMASEPPRHIVIGLSGHAGNGKDTAASMASGWLHDAHPDWDIAQVGFADAVKAAARVRGWNGLKDEIGRTVLQRVGMEGRSVNPNVWIDLLLHQTIGIERPPTKNCVWFVTDMRFRNEAEAVKNAGGFLWRIERVNPDGTPFINPVMTDLQRQHPSETDLDHFGAWDSVITPSTIAENRRMVLHALSEAHLL